METFADLAETKGLKNPTKYITSTLEHNGTRLYYQTTPHHPSENKDPNERILNLEIGAEFSENNKETIAKFIQSF